MDSGSPTYTVLARRFRPQTFDEVVGQQNVAQALKNAIAGDRVAHAYLFTGARGVGKTSMARILAKALNCPHTSEGIPCNQCEICEGITSGGDVDVQEIDGASNRRIEDVRAIRSQVNIKSLRTRYKMYIIDEVHMLTNEAFNALLKTLEEPPPNVVFVFCTTEPNKVPDTILSRCQRFDFSTIDTQRIAERLHDIATAEGFQVEAEALELVARRAAGSMRDSQSLFDQVLAFGGERIRADDVHRLLGTANDERLIALGAAIVGRQQAEALQLFDLSLQEGVQVGELVEQLLAYFRDLMVLAAGAGQVTLMSVAEGNRGRLTDQSQQWGVNGVLAALEILSETRMRLRQFVFTRVIAELAIVRLSTLEDLASIDRLAAQMAAEASVGGLQSSSAAARTAPAKSSSSGPSGSAADGSQGNASAGRQKKTLDVAETPPESPVVTTSPAEVIPLEAGSEARILRQLIAINEDMLKKHLQAVSRLAISGPNSVVLHFPPSYTFSKEYCGRPEVLSRLQRQLGEVVGAGLTLSLADEDQLPASVDSQTAAAGEGGKPPAAGRSTTAVEINPDEDGFVQQAIEVFGAKVVRVEPGAKIQQEG